MISSLLKYLVLSLLLINGFTAFAQTTIFSDPGPYSFNGIDIPATETFNVDVSDCTSISVSFNYEFSLPWEGVGNMESCDECPGCGCDPLNSVSGGCTPCWDFIYGDFQLGGTTFYTDLIGDTGTTDLEQSGIISSGYVCTDGETDLTIDITTNTWAGDETSTFTNVVVMCYQAIVTDIIIDPDLCDGQDIDLEGEALNNGDVDTWSWSTDGGSSIDDNFAQNTFTVGASDGETFTLIAGDINGCTSSLSETIFLNSSPTASIDQSSDGELCFGECTIIKFDFLGGSEPYDLDLTFTISGIGFPINFNAPGFAASDGITICYDIGGLFPQYDAASQTISVPEIAAGFGGDFTLNGFTDANGCTGIVGGSGFNVQFLDTPEANFASLEECDEGGGMATFDLTEMDDEVNGGSGETVRYYSDINLNNEIFAPYLSSTSVIYATVSNADCTSPGVELDLIVITDGDAGEVEIFCSEIGNIDCTICDDDGTLGESIEILFSFNDPSQTHDIILDITDNAGSTQNLYNLPANQTSINLNINSNTTLELLSVTEGEGCPDNTDLGDAVTITYTLAPELNAIGPFSECASVTLPTITGNNLTGSELYYTMPNGVGDSFAAGEVITTSTDLYVYSGVADCFDEILVEIEILPGTTFDQPNDTIICGPYTLPEISGTGVQATAVYFTLPGGNGNIFIPGNMVLSSTTLYIFDPSSSCSSNEPSFDITINQEPTINAIDNVDTCSTYELPLITGMLLTGDQAYFTEPNGMGMELLAGDTIFVSDTIYAYDNNAGCEAEIEIEIIIDEGPTAGVGDTISFCATTPQILNLPALLNEPADTLGLWSDDMGILMDDTDSTMVDVTGITGTINFTYVIENIACGNDTSHLQINLQEQLDAGGSDLLIGCTNEISNIDLNLFWNIAGINDTIIVLDGADINVDNPNSVDLSNLSQGIYNLEYIVGVGDSECTPDTADLTLQIEESPNAGTNVSTSACQGSIVELPALLEGNSSVGTFGDPAGTGALFGDNVDTGLLTPGTYTFLHSVAGTANCPSEIIEISVEVTNDVTSGNAVVDTICYTEQINLFDFLDGGSLGGTFFDVDGGNVEIVDGIIILDNWDDLPAGTAIQTSSVYSVGDDVDCAISTSPIEILVLPRPEIDLNVLQSTICENILDVEIDYTYLFGFDFTIIIDGSLPELPLNIAYEDINPPLPSSDLLSLQIDLEQYNLPSDMEYTISIGSVTRGDCVTDIMNVPDTFYIGRQDTLTVVDVICGSESVTYNGMVYNASNPTDTIRIPRPGQCDSIITINLDITEPATSLIDDVLCTGQTVTLGGQEYSESFPSGSFILFGDAANGCDSTVFVELTFGDASVNDITEDICVGEELLINGIIYDQNNLIGSDTIFGGSIGGCDSIINVNLTPITTAIGLETEITCDQTYSIVVNGVTYNFDNKEGTEVIENGSSSGCDSTVNINLTYLDLAVSAELSTICTGEFVVVNGMTYDENQLVGTEIILGGASNGCDSVVNVNLTLIETVEGDFINSSCDVTYFIMINGNTYDIITPEGTELIEGGAVNGCDSLVNIQLTFDGIVADTEVVQPDCNTETGSIVINTISGIAPFIYTLSGDDFEISSLPTTIENIEGNGDIIITDADGCEVEFNYEIIPFVVPVVSAEVLDDQIIVTGISLDDINSVEWLPSAGLSCVDCLTPMYSVEEDTEYTVLINYGTNCTVELTVLIIAEEVPETPGIPEYYVPNVFSPNGDGNNDIFYITPNEFGSSTIASMTIFDRWGNQIYSRENYITETNEGWDGTYNDQELNPGVYVYVIEILEGETIKPIYGDVTIVK